VPHTLTHAPRKGSTVGIHGCRHIAQIASQAVGISSCFHQGVEGNTLAIGLCYGVTHALQRYYVCNMYWREHKHKKAKNKSCSKTYELVLERMPFFLVFGKDCPIEVYPCGIRHFIEKLVEVNAPAC
jgi:hypothetical protein